MEAAIRQAYLDPLTPAERESVGLDPVAKDDEPVRFGDELECLAGREFPLDEGGAGCGRRPRFTDEPDEPWL